jgi:hypothetical protein
MLLAIRSQTRRFHFFEWPCFSLISALVIYRAVSAAYGSVSAEWIRVGIVDSISSREARTRVQLTLDLERALFEIVESGTEISLMRRRKPLSSPCDFPPADRSPNEKICAIP